MHLRSDHLCSRGWRRGRSWIDYYWSWCSLWGRCRDHHWYLLGGSFGRRGDSSVEIFCDSWSASNWDFCGHCHRHLWHLDRNFGGHGSGQCCWQGCRQAELLGLAAQADGARAR